MIEMYKMLKQILENQELILARLNDIEIDTESIAEHHGIDNYPDNEDY